MNRDLHVNNVSWQDALERLKAGNRRFQEDKSTQRTAHSATRSQLVDGQSPFAAILTCADSRVVPEYIFDADLGDLFVVRVAGITPNASSLASLEYAVSELNVKLLVAMGHESCGAVTAAIAGVEASKNLNHLLKFITPAFVSSPDPDVDAVSRLNARNTAAAMARDSEIIRDAINSGDLRIGSAFFHLGSGLVEFD